MKCEKCGFEDGYLNTTEIIMEQATKPCWWLMFCPYGRLVEYYPLRHDRNEFSCKVFGHDCPVFYNIEAFQDANHGYDFVTKSLDKTYEEFVKRGQLKKRKEP
jgi:hypothetical protein